MRKNHTIRWQKLSYIVVLLTMTFYVQAQAQQRTITGVVQDESSQTPIAGASVTATGGTTSTLTDEKGFFTLQVSESVTSLAISFVGYTPKTITLGESNNLTILLNATDTEIEEIVVTALGINREQKSLTYSTQQLGGEELTRVKGTNMINSINGKVAGVNISSSSSGIGGSAKVVLRGNKSASGSNQVLYVIDGVPLNSTATTGQPGGYFGGERDGGDPIALINPEDIESMSVLKGPSAAALYGSQAANGVILITTKSGKNGRTNIDFSSSMQIENPLLLPALQQTYGQGSGGVSGTDFFSWGERLETPSTNDIHSFYNTGTNFTNSLSLSQGSERTQTYLSYANVAAKGLLPQNTLNRHNINLKQTGNFLDNRLTVEAGINYILQDLDNVPLTGFYFNPIVGLYLLPPDRDLLGYRTFETFNPTTGRYEQNWYTINDPETTQQNPWWIQNRNTSMSNRDRLLLNGSVKYRVNNWLTLQSRGSMDRSHELFEREIYAGTQSILARPNGGYQQSEITVTQKYADFIANFTTNIYDNLKFNGLIGTSITDWNTEGTSFSSALEGLTIANIFAMQNSITPLSTTSPNNRRQLQSVFASANFSYDDWLFLDLTDQNQNLWTKQIIWLI